MNGNAYFSNRLANLKTLPHSSRLLKDLNPQFLKNAKIVDNKTRDSSDKQSWIVY
jgi:hypothetical protein